MSCHQPDFKEFVNLDQSQQISLVTAILGGNLSVAAILFGVLGFIYAIYAGFASPHMSEKSVNEMSAPIVPSPVLAPLALIARFIFWGFVLSLLIAFGCFIWFICPEDWLLITVSVGLLLELLALVGVGYFIVFRFTSIS